MDHIKTTVNLLKIEEMMNQTFDIINDAKISPYDAFSFAVSLFGSILHGVYSEKKDRHEVLDLVCDVLKNKSGFQKLKLPKIKEVDPDHTEFFNNEFNVDLTYDIEESDDDESDLDDPIF